MGELYLLPTNASKWQMGFNLAFKGLNVNSLIIYSVNWSPTCFVMRTDNFFSALNKILFVH